MNLRQLATIACCAAALFGSAGCAHVKTATEDAVAWVRDALQTNLEAPLPKAVAAATEALRELQFVAVAAKSDAFSGEVTGKTAKDEQVTVRLTALNERQTRIDIRVGAFGDKVVSQRILDETKKGL